MKTDPLSKEHAELRHDLFYAAKELFSEYGYHEVIRIYEKEYDAIVDIGVGETPGRKAASNQTDISVLLSLLELNNEIIFEIDSLQSVGETSNQLCKNKEKSE